MKIITVALGIAIAGAALSACSFVPANTYCLQEQEANGLDYMVVTNMNVCDNSNSDAEYYETNESLEIGDIAYVEADGDHSVKRLKRHENVKTITNPPTLTTQAPRPVVAPPTKICLKAASKPAPPAPKPPAPAPVPKPPAVAPKPQPAPVVPKAPVNNPTQAPAPTVKPGC